MFAKTTLIFRSPSPVELIVVSIISCQPFLVGKSPVFTSRKLPPQKTGRAKTDRYWVAFIGPPGVHWAIPSLKLTYPLKIGPPWKRRFRTWKPIIFRGENVSFRECNFSNFSQQQFSSASQGPPASNQMCCDGPILQVSGRRMFRRRWLL